MTNIERLSNINPFFFPKNNNWYWLPIIKRNFTLSPGETLELWNKTGAGWIYGAMVWANNPYLTLKIDVYADSVYEITVNYNTLKAMGSYAIGQGFFMLTRYDDTNNVYVAQYAPIGLGVPFRGKNRGVLYNPTTSTITVVDFHTWLIMLKDE